jgi:hypothetical protein
MFDVVATWSVKNEPLRLKPIGVRIVIVLIALALLSLAHFGFGWLSSSGYYAALSILVAIVTMLIEECLKRPQTQKQRAQQHGTFCCLHCTIHKPVEQLSTTINMMCKECADLHEVVQDEV